MILDKINGTIIEVQILPEYEGEAELEIDILLDSGPVVEMCVTEEAVKKLYSNLHKTVCFDITDRSPCGQHVRAVAFEISPHD